jgi:SAM-dependent methyltransferase
MMEEMVNELTKAAWYSTFYRNIFTEVSYSNNNNNSKVTLSWNQAASESEFDDSLPHPRATTTQNEPFQPWVSDVWSEAEKEEAEALLQRNKSLCALAPEKAVFFEEAARKKWDLFYKLNGNRFFKDRNYLKKVFPELTQLLFERENEHCYTAAASRRQQDSSTGENTTNDSLTVAEVGCGVGNSILPIIEQVYRKNKETKHKRIFHFVATDFSPVALDILQQDRRYIKAPTYGVRVNSAVWDITLPQSIPTCVNGLADVTIVLFCLSAISPEKQRQAVGNIANTLRPGGTLIFRDYARYDAAQMKLGLSKQKQISPNFYLKHNGTRCYYFSIEELNELFVNAGLEQVELQYIQRKYMNRGELSVRRRVWVQARYRKP